MSTSLSKPSTLARFLGRARRRFQLVASLQAFLCSGLALGLLGFVLGLFFWLGKSGWNHYLWYTGGTFCLVFLALQAARIWKLSKDPILARSIENWSRESAGLFTAVELSRDMEASLDPLHYSRGLASARVQQVSWARVVESVDEVQNAPRCCVF